jgi:hypothetical protein
MTRLTLSNRYQEKNIQERRSRLRPFEKASGTAFSVTKKTLLILHLASHTGVWIISQQIQYYKAKTVGKDVFPFNYNGSRNYHAQ